MKIAIPSYNRYNRMKTLETLHRHNIPKDMINVFVVEEEYDLYKKHLNPEHYNKLIIGKKGLINQRKYIEDYYALNTEIVSCDDDIDDFDIPENKTLANFFNQAFETCMNKNAYIWGVYPVYNKFYREKQKPLSEDLVFICGCFYGFINRKIEELDCSICIKNNTSQKEDVEKTLKYYLKDGIVLRFNNVGVKTRYYSVGGLGNLKSRLDENNMIAQELCKAYPEYMTLKTRKNGLNEIVFKSISIPKQLDKFHFSLTEKLEYLLNNTKFNLQRKRRGHGRGMKFGEHYCGTLGYMYHTWTKTYGLSAFTRDNQELYEEVKKIGNIICPFPFNSIHINKNVVCPPHKDGNNSSKSMLFSIGDYEGCNLVVSEIEYDTRYRPIIFDGRDHIHYNTPLISGTKYSLIFYNSTPRGKILDGYIGRE